MKRFIATAAAFGILTLQPAGLGAQEVTLTSKSTGFVLAGRLLEFDGENYILQSTIGKLTVPTNDIVCAGEACPSLDANGAPAPNASQQEVAIAPPTPTPSVTGIAPADQQPNPPQPSAALPTPNQATPPTPSGAGSAPQPSPAPLATAAFDRSFGVFGSNAIGAGLMPSLIESYSDTLGAVTEREVGGDDLKATVRLKDENGVEIASIDLRAEGSASAFDALRSGDALIGMSSRPAKSEEIERLAGVGSGRLNQAGNEHILALDGMILIVSEDNPLTTINILDAADILAGEIENWSEIGGPDERINVYAPQVGTGSYDTLRETLLDPIGGDLTPDAEAFVSNERLSDAVANDPYGIGFTGLAYQRNTRALAIETACGIVVSPTDFNVKTEEYPLSRRLYLYTTGAPLPGSAKGLLDYALSDDAQIEIADIGFVNQEISSISLNDQGRRVAEAFIQPRDPQAVRLMRDLAIELLDARRLSTTLRFQPSSSVLDVKSEGDLRRLARHLVEGGAPDKQVMLIGFADDAQRLQVNLSLSEQRSLQISASLKAEIAKLGGDPEDFDILSLGYGDLSPVSCVDDEFSQVSNRRVEVWLRDQL